MPGASGDAEYILGRSASEYERLVEQGGLLGPPTERVLRAAGCTTGMRVLDVGCGVGEVARVVGEIVGPTGTVVGIDVDEDAVVLAGQRLRSLGVDFTGVVGDFRTVDVGDGYDMVCCRMVLQYQSDALRRSAQWVHGCDPAAWWSRMRSAPRSRAGGPSRPSRWPSAWRGG